MEQCTIDIRMNMVPPHCLGQAAEWRSSVTMAWQIWQNHFFHTVFSWSVMSDSCCYFFCSSTTSAAMGLVLNTLLPESWGMQFSWGTQHQAGASWAPAPAASRFSDGAYSSVIVRIAERCCCSCSVLEAVQTLDLTGLATFMFPPILILQKNNLKTRARQRRDPPHGLHGCACGSRSCSS